MKQVQLIKTGKVGEGNLVENEDVPLPQVEEGEVLLKVEACGICYRDIIDREGGNSFVSTPITLGHEIAGVVLESTVPG